MANSEVLNVYRAIMGPFTKTGDDFLYHGVTDEQLEQKGIFNKNFLQKIDFDRFNEPARYVVGLPVFLSKIEAETFLGTSRRFDQAPAIVTAAIPLAEFESQAGLQIVRNTLLVKPSLDVVLTPIELIQHIQGVRVISGECFLRATLRQRIPEGILKGRERFYRPTLDQSGHIMKEAGFQEVSIRRN